MSQPPDSAAWRKDERTAQLAALGELAAGVAHELNNPLTSVIGFAKWLLKAPNLTAEQKEDLERIASESQRCSRIIKNMLEFSRVRPGQMQVFALSSLVDDAVELFRCASVGIPVTVSAADKPSVKGDRPQLQRALLILLGASREALSGRKGGKIEVRVRAEGDKAVVELVDDGGEVPGRAGALAEARRILGLHEGAVESAGGRAVITLPAAKEGA